LRLARGGEIIGWVGGNLRCRSLMFWVCEIVAYLGTHSHVASSHQVSVQPNRFLFGTQMFVRLSPTDSSYPKMGFKTTLSIPHQRVLQTATHNRFAFHRAAKMSQLDGRPKRREGGTSEVEALRRRERGGRVGAAARRGDGGVRRRRGASEVAARGSGVRRRCGAEQRGAV
jgi:hypothetical protein